MSCIDLRDANKTYQSERQQTRVCHDQAEVVPNFIGVRGRNGMDTLIAATRSRSPEISVAAGKPILRGIHHLALVTDDMRMTLDFYVRVLGMPIVHGLRTPSRPAGASHGDGAPPYSNIPHY